MKLMLAALSVLMALSLPALTAENPPGPPLGAGGPAPKTEAPPAKKVLAVVGGTEITSDQIDQRLSKEVDLNSLTPDQRDKVKTQYTKGLIATILVHKLLEKEKVTCSDKEIAAFCEEEYGKKAKDINMSVVQFIKAMGIPKTQLQDQAGLTKLLSDVAVAKDKVDAFIKNNPDYFNGTKVRASHILLKCDALTSTQEQLKTKKKLEQLAADIKDKKITFEEAAKKHSECPSKKDNGDLKEFTFERIIPVLTTSFSVAAFKVKKGEISPVIRTQQGFHLIKVTDRSEGSDSPGLDAKQIARGALRDLVNDKILEMVLTNCQIEIK